MIDSKGKRYDGWAIAWDINGEEYASIHTLAWTRSECIRKWMKVWPKMNWRQMKRYRGGTRCIKVSLNAV